MTTIYMVDVLRYIDVRTTVPIYLEAQTLDILNERIMTRYVSTLQFFVRLDHIRKCFTQNGGIFVLEEFSK